MNDPQIDILARVYVKDVYGGDTDFIDEAEQVLTWLSQRYCIVEKDKVKEEFETSTHNYEVSGGLRPYRQQYFLGRCAAVKALFPSIAKEMEE